MRTLTILKTLSAVAAASAVAITATTGKASAVGIDLFSAPGALNQVLPSFTYNDIPGNTLTATGSVQTILAGTQPRSVFRSSNGLGVTNALLDSSKVDGVLPETLTLAFTQAVNLTSVSFTGVGLLDSFTFLNGGTSVFTQNIPGQLLGNGTYTYTFNSPQTGTSFGFRASQPTSAFYVSSINVAAVPEPITIAGMALGSGFGVLLRRKYKKGAKFSNKLST